MADAVAVMDALGWDKAWVIGHSWGGHLAMHLAAARPDRVLGMVALDALGAVRQPVLQILGSASRPIFREATMALDARLRDGRVVEIDGARHAAHHTHPDEIVDIIQAFLA